MKTWLVFGLWDDAWWPLWENEAHRGTNAQGVSERIEHRLAVNGEDGYEAIAVLPKAFWNVERLRREE